MLGSGWGSWAARRQSWLGSARLRLVVRVAVCVLLFVLCILLVCIVVVTVSFVCCSAKLPLSRPTNPAVFACFFSILLCTPAGGGGGGEGRQGNRLVLLLPAAAKL